jgi:hypothetical protein
MKNLVLQKYHISDLTQGDIFKFHRKQKTWCIFITYKHNKTKTNKRQCIVFYIENDKIEQTPFVLSMSFCYKIT